MKQRRILRKANAQYVLILVPLGWLIVASFPEVMRDRIFPFDSALIAANGALFHMMFTDIVSFLSAPVDWLWAYYDQYPALSVRRHPPLFGMIAGLIYSVFGVSASSAKLTVLLFGLVFAVGVYRVAQRLSPGILTASATTLLVVATPQIGLHFSSVWLDIPSMAFVMWVFYFYLGRLEGNRSTRNVLLIVIFTVLALYTYQPPIVLLAGIVLHWAYSEWNSLIRDRSLWIGFAVLFALMLPLAAFTMLVAADNLLVATGEIPEVWKEFDSPTYAQWMVTDRLSSAYWIAYARMLGAIAPIQCAGVLLWVALRWVRKPAKSETLMFVCLVVTYLGFSWLIVKGHRYTLYMLVPATFLSVMAVRDLFWRLTGETHEPGRQAGAVMLLLAMIQGALASPYVPYSKLSGMQEPVSFLLESDSSPTVFYSGRADAAFVFYARSLDEDRRLRIHRASVQLPEPLGLSAYIEDNGIDFIVVEIENRGYDQLEIIDRFRDVIVATMSESEEFRRLSEFRLPYGTNNVDGHVLIHIYGRYRQTATE